MHPRPSEIWLADLGLSAKTRPVMIVSRFDPDAPRALIIYGPLTTQNRESSYKVPVPRLAFLNAVSFVNCRALHRFRPFDLSASSECYPKAPWLRYEMP